MHFCQKQKQSRNHGTSTREGSYLWLSPPVYFRIVSHILYQGIFLSMLFVVLYLLYVDGVCKRAQGKSVPARVAFASKRIAITHVCVCVGSHVSWANGIFRFRSQQRTLSVCCIILDVRRSERSYTSKIVYQIIWKWVSQWVLRAIAQELNIATIEHISICLV